MFIAMNRFKITLGKEEEFITVWKNRESQLDKVPGFQQFHLLQGVSTDEYTLFASHVIWETHEAFEAWVHSEAFRQAHAKAGGTRELYLEPPQFEGFEVIL